MTKPVSRAIALLLGLFLAVNAAARAAWPSFDALVWLIDLRRWGLGPALALLLLAAGVLIGFAIRPQLSGVRRATTLVVVGVLCAIALMDSIRAAALSGNGQVRLGSLVTFSSIVLVSLVIVGHGAAAAWTGKRVKLGVPIAMATGAVCLAAFPFAQMVSFGLTDYRRPADAILVFGARTYADGRASDALEDRMRTACELFHQGLASRLILSGGPGDGPIHETQTMRRLALESGIPDQALILDTGGISTRATVANAAAIARKQGLGRVLAVSHFYHLPRIKLQADRAGLMCFTVPSPQGHPLNRLPYFIARETAACWVYYLRP